MSAPFATDTAALAADVKTPTLAVWIGHTPTACVEAHTAHGTEQPVGTCSLVLPAPRPAWVDYNADVTVQAGYAEGSLATIFRGRIPTTSEAFDEQGGWVRVSCVGYLSLLQWADYTDLWISTTAGPVPLAEAVMALLARREVPMRWVDPTTYPDGTTSLDLAGVAEVDGGKLHIPRNTAPLDFFGRAARLFGYRLFDRPDGFAKLQRISGRPPNAPAIAFTEGVDLLQVGHDRDLTPMVTYWEVLGAKYTSAADGTQVAIRSIPAAVPYDARLDPPGYKHDQISDQLLVTQALADAARNVAEIDYGAPTETVPWTSELAPTLQPGDVASVTSATTGTAGTWWVRAVHHDVTDQQGATTQWEGWAGGGTALAAGSDCVSQALGSGVYHLGDETIPWYAHPAPMGGYTDANGKPQSRVDIPFTVAADYSTIKATAQSHGCNSYYIGGQNTTSTVSTFEIWQNQNDGQGFRRIGGGDLPVQNEDYAQEYPYATDDRYWTTIAIPISGSLKAGSATLRIVAGTDADAVDGPVDDFEVKSITLTTCGVGVPTLPEGG